VAVALVANVAVTVTKVVAGVVSGSSAMLSEGAHSVSDTANELFLVRVELVDGLSSDDIEQMSSEIDTRLRALSPEITQVFVDATTSHERRRVEAARRSRPST